MSPEIGFGTEVCQPKKERIHTSKFFPHGRPSNPLISNTASTSAEPTMQWFPNVNTSPLSSTPSTSSSTPPTWPNHTWKAPDSKAVEKQQNHLQDALTEATKRAAVAERKVAEYLLAKEDAERQLQEQIAAKAPLSTSNERLTAENERLKEELQKLEKHTKNCEKATSKAQKEAKNAKGNADHLINSQKGQLKSAERRYAEATRDLNEWRDRYGWAVGKPAEENAALQVRLSEWQSKAEKARNEIAALKGGLVEQQSSVKNEEDPSRAVAEKHQSGNEVKGEPSSTKVEEGSNNAAAEAKAAMYKEERDTLHRVLQEEMARNAKLAESLVLRNAKVAESLEGWAADGGEC